MTYHQSTIYLNVINLIYIFSTFLIFAYSLHPRGTPHKLGQSMKQANQQYPFPCSTFFDRSHHGSPYTLDPPPLPKPLFLQTFISKILHQLTINLQVPIPDPELSNSPLRTPQCLAPYLQKVIPSSSSKPKAPLTRSPPSSIGKEADRRIELMILPLLYILQDLVYQALPDPAAALAQGGGSEGNPGWGQQGTNLRPMRVRIEEVGGENWRRNMGAWN